jgi:8-oxo-dGTP pyrophosphatase MutT (NUDIX family)
MLSPFYKHSTGNLFSNIVCTNCSNTGHTSKHCLKAVISYGIIIFRCKEKWNQALAIQRGKGVVTGLDVSGNTIEYLLIQRKDSIGFIELVRGKYKPTDYDYIRKNIAGMTASERNKIMFMSFDDLWETLWGPTKEGGGSYKYEKEQSRTKLEALRTGSPSLKTLIDECPTPFTTPEWGFPKGRKNINESDYSCAVRETWEETNIKEKDITIIRNLEPISEHFTGTNGVAYVHKYFLAYAEHGVGEESVAVAGTNNEHIKREVGDIRWCSIQEALELIRPENKEKRDILLRVDAIFKHYCPLMLGSAVL